MEEFIHTKEIELKKIYAKLGAITEVDQNSIWEYFESEIPTETEICKKHRPKLMNIGILIAEENEIFVEADTNETDIMKVAIDSLPETAITESGQDVIDDRTKDSKLMNIGEVYGTPQSNNKRRLLTNQDDYEFQKRQSVPVESLCPNSQTNSTDIVNGNKIVFGSFNKIQMKKGLGLRGD